MKCDQIRFQLVSFLFGDLPERELKRIASHLGRCPTCLEELQSLQSTAELLKGTSAARPQASFGGEGQQAPEVLRRVAPASPTRSPSLVRYWRRGRWVVVAASIGLLLAGLGLWRPLRSRSRGEPLAHVVMAVGQPAVRGEGNGPWRIAEPGTELSVSSSFRTGGTDRLDLELPDGSRVMLDFDTEAQLVRGGRLFERPFRLKLKAGRVWLLVAASSHRLAVETPAATVEALGTLFSVAVDQAGHAEAGAMARLRPGPEPVATTIAVLRGRVRVSNRHGTTTVPAGSRAEALGDRAPGEVARADPLHLVRFRAPWGQAGFEIWVGELLRPDSALERIAGRRSWLGVELARGPVELGGRPVTLVEPGSPGEAAGVRVGDVLVQVGPVAIGETSDLARSEFLLAPEAEVQVRVRRAGRDVVLPARLAENTLIRLSDSAAESLQRASNAVLRGEWTEAARLYRELPDLDGGTAAAFNNLGVIRELDGHLEEASRYYEEAVRLDPDVPLYHFNLSMVFSRIGNLPRAAEHLASAVECGHAPTAVQFALGRALALEGDVEGATELAQRLQSQPATTGSGCCLMGEIRRLQGDLNEAAKWYVRAVEASPYDALALTCLGAAYFSQDNLSAARDAIERALALDPNSLSALNRLGLILYREKRFDEALYVLRRAATEDPASAAVQNNIGMVYFEMGDVASAIAAYQQGIRLQPNTVFCHLGLAIAFEQSGRLEDAKREYAVVLRLDPTCKDAYHSLGRLYEKLGEAQLAEAVSTKLRQYGL